MASTRYLTKSRFKIALDCPNKLFYTKKGETFTDKSVDDAFMEALAEGGFQVGELAKCYKPGGVDVVSLDEKEALDITNVEMAKEVREAFDNNRIVPYFQPIIDTNTNKVVQYECLARMVTAQGEVLKPDAFLNVVTRSRMDGILTRTIFSQCVSRFRKTDICWITS